jgi:hypothetical protein
MALAFCWHAGSKTSFLEMDSLRDSQEIQQIKIRTNRIVTETLLRIFPAIHTASIQSIPGQAGGAHGFCIFRSCKTFRKVS